MAKLFVDGNGGTSEEYRRYIVERTEGGGWGRVGGRSVFLARTPSAAGLPPGGHHETTKSDPAETEDAAAVMPPRTRLPL